jgi:hypothetical protein
MRFRGLSAEHAGFASVLKNQISPVDSPSAESRWLPSRRTGLIVLEDVVGGERSRDAISLLPMKTSAPPPRWCYG